MRPGISTAALAAIALASSACSCGGKAGSTPPASHAISGTVSGAVAAGVTISLTGAATATTTTDANGSYQFGGLADGSYAVAPSLAGYAFSPVSIAVTVSGADVPGQDFTASAAGSTYSVSGAVGGAVLGGVTVTLEDAGGGTLGTTVTDATGGYVFGGLAGGSYTLTPSLTGYTFAPQSLSVTIGNADVTGRDFTASPVPTTFSVSGKVSGAVVSGVTVSLAGAAAGTTTTDANGDYAFPGLSNGSYTVAASMAGYSFSPASIAVDVRDADVTGRNFTATAATNTYVVSGTVGGDVAAGVTVTLSGSNGGTAITDANGDYTFGGLSSGSYTITPSLAGYTFSPSSITLDNLSANATGQDFTATAVPGAYTISGNVSGDVASGVTVTLTDTATGGTVTTMTAITNQNGDYSFTGVADGSYTLTPGMKDITFTPSSIQVTVNGADVPDQDFTATFSLRIVTSTLPPGRVGQAYSQRVTAWGGATPYTFTASGLPAWLTITTTANASGTNDGTLSGTPAAAGTFTFTVTVTDQNGSTASKQLSVTVH